MIAHCGAGGKQPGHAVAHSELATVELHGGVQLNSAAVPAQVLWGVSLEHAKGREGQTEKESLATLGFVQQLREKPPGWEHMKEEENPLLVHPLVQQVLLGAGHHSGHELVLLGPL